VIINEKVEMRNEGSNRITKRAAKKSRHWKAVVYNISLPHPCANYLGSYNQLLLVVLLAIRRWSGAWIGLTSCELGDRQGKAIGLEMPVFGNVPPLPVQRADVQMCRAEVNDQDSRSLLEELTTSPLQPQ
jgi:hypothetical protein